jgi:hypothetical protein
MPCVSEFFVRLEKNINGFNVDFSQFTEPFLKLEASAGASHFFALKKDGSC